MATFQNTNPTNPINTHMDDGTPLTAGEAAAVIAYRARKNKLRTRSDVLALVSDYRAVAAAGGPARISFYAAHMATALEGMPDTPLTGWDLDLQLVKLKKEAKAAYRVCSV